MLTFDWKNRKTEAVKTNSIAKFNSEFTYRRNS